MSYTLVVAEKPSVARDIARVLGARERGEGYISGGEYCVTWALGHLVALSDPDEIDPKWKTWRTSELPMLPEVIPLKILPKTRKQFTIVKKLMLARDCERLVCATDAGREGELIFRYLLRMVGCEKPVQRLWISSMTDEAIRDGLASMKPGAAYDNLYESARCRSEADWLVGMNASRAFTLRYNALLSVGRVQTPTLALIVRRHHEITAFVSKDYWTIAADFDGYTGLWLNETTLETRVYEAEAAQAIATKVQKKPAVVESIRREAKTDWPPYLFDLTSLQRDANRLLGFTAQKTLSVAQKLYEEYKLLTYPRTDSRHLPCGMVGQVKKALQSLPEAFRTLAEPVLRGDKLPMPRRIFDDAKVSDHHAIIPTGKQADLEKLPPDVRALYQMVARRLIAAFYPEHRYNAVRVLTRAQGEAFESLGREIVNVGWKAVYASSDEKASRDDEPKALPQLTEGETRTVRKASVRKEQTKPPAPHTDASLLGAMEHAGRDLEDEELRESMKKGGLGTPATRAAILERLITVGYAERKGKTLQATEKGVKLIAVVPPDIASPETTGRWEKALSDIVSGGMEPDRFLSGIRRLAASLTESAKSNPTQVVFDPDPKKAKRTATPKPAPLSVTCPVCREGKALENSRSFYCSRWKEGCKFTIWKDGFVKQGGPLLTAEMAKRLIKEGEAASENGLLYLEKGVARFVKQGDKR